MAASRELIKEHYNQHVEEGVTTKEVSSSTALLAKSAKRDMAAHMTYLMPSRRLQGDVRAQPRPSNSTTMKSSAG